MVILCFDLVNLYRCPFYIDKKILMFLLLTHMELELDLPGITVLSNWLAACFRIPGETSDL